MHTLAVVLSILNLVINAMNIYAIRCNPKVTLILIPDLVSNRLLFFNY